MYSPEKLPSTMRAWQMPTPGDLLTLLSLNINRPLPPSPLKKSQLLVRIHSACLNPADYKVYAMGTVVRLGLSFPRVPGMDFSGLVVAAGPDTHAKVGDAVCGLIHLLGTTVGSLGEYAVVDEKSAVTFGKGHSTTPEEFDAAAGLGVAGLTAYQTIAPFVAQGDKVFINGGSGGVGTYGIQIAKLLGCHVTVSCSTQKAELCRSLGADEIIDYKTTSVTEVLKKGGAVYKLVVDNVTNNPPDLYATSNTCLLPGGRYEFVGGNINLGIGLSLAKGMFLPGFLGGGKHKLDIYMAKLNRKDYGVLAGWLDEGKIKTIVDSVWEFDQVPQAFKKLKEGSAAGKIVVRVKDGKGEELKA